MTNPIIIEAAARALDLNIEDISTREIEEAARAVLAAVAPLIEAAALEKAAKLVEGYTRRDIVTFDEVATAIRALITKDSGGGD